jgi:hypothetical protein
LRGRGGTGEANEFYVPEDGGSRASPSSVVAGRREERQLAAASVAAAASGSEVELVAVGAGRNHPHPGGAADHAMVVHPGRADRRRPGAAEEPVVEAGPRGAVVAERAGGVVEVPDLRRRVVVVRGAHGCEGRVRVCAGGRAVSVPVPRLEERDGPRGEEVLGGGVSPRAGGVAPTRAAPDAGTAGATAHPLHALEVEAVLLEVGGHVLAREAVDAHQLHYGLGHGVLDAEVCHRIDEALVQLRRPHQARPLERPGRLVPGAPTPAAGPGGRRRAAAAVHLRPARDSSAAAPAVSPRAAGTAAAVRADVEGDGEIGRDERLRDGHQLVRPRQLLLTAREPAGLLLPHGQFFSPSAQLTAGQAGRAIRSTTCVGQKKQQR